MRRNSPPWPSVGDWETARKGGNTASAPIFSAMRPCEGVLKRVSLGCPSKEAPRSQARRTNGSVVDAEAAVDTASAPGLLTSWCILLGF